MAKQQFNQKSLMVGGLVGCIITIFLVLAYLQIVNGDNIQQTNLPQVDSAEPLYWVAPMDANYKRDKPGKSPMGMDLVPVYETNTTGPNEGAGTIRISPAVINNLGVRTAQVSYQTLHTEINTVGYVTYDEDKLVHIHPRVQGWIEKLHVKAIGDRVVKGQALYEIYSPELVNAQEELLLALDRKNTRLIRAAENRLMALQLPISAISQLKKTRKVQQRIIFHAPQNGVVENLKIREGYFVKPGSTLMSVGDLSEVWVEAEVFERQAGQVKTGTPVTMTLDYLPGKVWQGKVDYIYPVLDAKTRTVKVRLRFSNKGGDFKPNMFAQIAIHTTADENTLLIPREALIRTGNQDRVVLALGEGSYKSIAVKVGRYDSDNVEILDGLAEGEYVVSSAQFLLDSESSKSSDFKRMITASVENSANAVWVTAQVQQVIASHGKVNVTHEAISQWSWPEMTMEFSVDKSVDLSLLSPGLTLHIEISKMPQGDYLLTNIHIPDTSLTQEVESSEEQDQRALATTTGVINSLMVEHGMINISRAAIDKWNRPAATVDFITAKGVSLEGLAPNMTVEFTFTVQNANFVITKIKQIAHEKQQDDSHSNHVMTSQRG